MMKEPKSSHLEETKRLMAALGRRPPKPHEDMKIGRTRAVAKKRSKRKKKA